MWELGSSLPHSLLHLLASPHVSGANVNSPFQRDLHPLPFPHLGCLNTCAKIAKFENRVTCYKCPCNIRSRVQGPSVQLASLTRCKLNFGPHFFGRHNEVNSPLIGSSPITQRLGSIVTATRMEIQGSAHSNPPPASSICSQYSLLST